MRASGWTFVALGATVLLYLVYSLFFTNLATEAAQADLRQAWERRVGDVGDDAAPTSPAARRSQPDGLAAGAAPQAREARSTAGAQPDEPAERIESGSAVAILQFARPGSDIRPVEDEPLFVVEGVGRQELTRGPGHYPGTALPGQIGNLAVAGHRTTYGAPFFHLDQLRPGDEVVVTDRRGATWRYRVVGQRVVEPTDVWVIGSDPLGSDRPTLTLTTCYPRFSDRQRLIVFAELAP